MKRVSCLSRDRSGVTAVEFAIILPAMLTLICGSLEIGHMIFARVVLDGAVIDAARVATASLETGEAERTEIMRNSITAAMRTFPRADNRVISIETEVFRDFNTVRPETFSDVNENGKYDLGEPFVDRNENGKWDPAAPITGTLGGPGDVVSYTAVYPKKVLFTYLAPAIGIGDWLDIKSTTVVRNESVVRRTS